MNLKPRCIQANGTLSSIRETTEVVDGQDLELVEAEYTSAPLLQVTVGTNAPQGGDSGHGGRTLLRFEDLGGFDATVLFEGKRFQLSKLEIVCGGDCEAQMIVEALRNAADTLEEQIKDNQEKRPAWPELEAEPTAKEVGLSK